MADHSPPPPTADLADGISVPWHSIDRFVGQVIHDLRNGLNSVELQLANLLEISTDPEAVTEVKRLRTGLGGLARQLQALKVMVGPVTPHLLRYRANDLLEDLRERFARKFPEESRLEWHHQNDATVLQIDPELTLAAILELLANALHFATPGEPIIIHAEAAAGGSSLTISELPATPPSLSPADWGRAPLRTERRAGYGLGLFRARRILEAQGARLDCELEPGNGRLRTTVFLAAAAAAEDGVR